MSDVPRQVCFVDMPFGKKTDPKSRVEIDFDRIYDLAICPAVEDAGLQCVRGDREETGGLIHAAMFARLLLSEFVIADMTTANPNVFYELGVRHAAKPYTTIPLFAMIAAPPFDVNMVRAIPYQLADGRLSEEAAAELRAAIRARIERALAGPVTKDSPLFDLFDDFPGIEISHELTDVFRDRVAYSQALKDRLAEARKRTPREAAVAAIAEIQASLGELKTTERGALVDLLLSYRAVEAWDEMLALYDKMPGDVREADLVGQQIAFALNRRNRPGDRERAVRELEDILARHGDSAETLGILGRVHKDRYREARDAGEIVAEGHLDLAIEAYTRGFEAEPSDYYPGVNALTLLLQKDTPEAAAEIERLAPLVTYAAVRRGGQSASDYWTVATVLELACINRDYPLVARTLPRAIALADEAWMLETTQKNLELIATRRRGEDGIEAVVAAIGELTKARRRFD